MHSNVAIKNVSWPHFSWPTLYIESLVLRRYDSSRYVAQQPKRSALTPYCTVSYKTHLWLTKNLMTRHLLLTISLLKMNYSARAMKPRGKTFSLIATELPRMRCTSVIRCSNLIRYINFRLWFRPSFV